MAGMPNVVVRLHESAYLTCKLIYYLLLQGIELKIWMRGHLDMDQSEATQQWRSEHGEDPKWTHADDKHLAELHAVGRRVPSPRFRWMVVEQLAGVVQGAGEGLAESGRRRFKNAAGVVEVALRSRRAVTLN